MKRKIFIIAICFGYSNLNSQSLSTNSNSSNDKRFFFYGTSTLNTTDDLVKSITGSQKFLMKCIIKKQNLDKRLVLGIEGTVGVNAINLKPTGISKDSIDLVSLMFPETGNFGFAATPKFTYYNSTSDKNKILNSLSFEFSLALRQNRVIDIPVRDSSENITDTEQINFSVLNWNIMPLLYRFRYTPDQDEKFYGELSLGIYYNYFNIPNEDARDFNKLFKKENPMFINPDKSAIHSIGGKFIASINGFMFYADLRHNFTKYANLSDDNPFKGFVFNAGFATNIEIFSR